MAVQHSPFETSQRHLDQLTGWTPETIEQAISEIEHGTTTEKTRQLALSYIPSAFIKAQPEMAYRFIASLFQNDPDLIPASWVKVYISALRELGGLSLPLTGSICDRAMKPLAVNAVLAHLVFPSAIQPSAQMTQLDVTGGALLQLRNYIYTGMIEPKLPIDDALSLISFTQKHWNSFIYEQAFRAMISRLEHQKDTLEERCAMLGLILLRTDIGRILDSLRGCYDWLLDKDVKALGKKGSILSLDLSAFQRTFNEAEISMLLQALSIIPEKVSFSALSLGPIRPAQLQNFVKEDSLEGSIFRSVLQTDERGISLRIRTVEDLQSLHNVCYGSLDRDGSLIITISDQYRIRVQIEEIEMAHALKDAEITRRLTPLFSRLKCRIIFGFCPFPGYLPYSNR